MLAMRERILRIVPDAVEVTSYGMPAFRVDGGVVAGLCAHARHVGYYPFSGSVLGKVAESIGGYRTTKSALHVPPDRPLPAALLRTLIRARLAEMSPSDLTTVALAAPARRALEHAGIRRLDDLRSWREADLADLHGMGPAAIGMLKAAMKRHGLRFST